MSDQIPLMEVQNLKKYFDQSTNIIDSMLDRGPAPVQAVDDVSLTISRNEVKGVIGESGCGKSTLLMTLLGLQEPTAGVIRYKGQDVVDFGRSQWKEFRRNVQVIFQDPFNSLDPMMTVEEILSEPLKIHNVSHRGDRIRDILQQVELQPFENYIHSLPSQLSGGEKQRVSLARALILEPELIFADEPVSMLDVSTQASILKMISRINDEHGVSMIYISHDLSTVSYICDEVLVMYLGAIAEQAPTKKLLNDPKHPYTRALIQAVPVPDPREKRDRVGIESRPKNPVGLGEGCRFRDRCPERMDRCEKTPMFLEVEENHYTACHLHYDHVRYSGDGVDDANQKNPEPELNQ